MHALLFYQRFVEKEGGQKSEWPAKGRKSGLRWKGGKTDERVS